MNGATVAIFGSSTTSPKQAEWLDAEAAGRTFADAGLSLVTGGYGGTMEAASRGAAAVGGHVIGVVAPSLFPSRPRSNPYVTQLIEAHSLPERIGTLIDRADAALVLPGAIGTAAELILIWNHNQIARGSGDRLIPLAAVGVQWAGIIGTLGAATSISGDGLYLARDCADGANWILRQLSNY